MILKAHVPGAEPYPVGDEISHQPLAEAIAAEADAIAADAGSDLLESPRAEHREQLRRRVIEEMTRALIDVGDSYRAPDGVLYSLLDEPVDDDDQPATIAAVSSTTPPIVQEVVRFEDLSLGSRRAIVRWSDGSHGPALTWYAEEVKITEGDVIGKTAEQLRTLHFQRDRDWLQS